MIIRVGDKTDNNDVAVVHVQRRVLVPYILTETAVLFYFERGEKHDEFAKRTMAPCHNLQSRRSSFPEA